MDSIFNYIIFLIPLAIFIGRAFSEAKNRRNRPSQPGIPIHFEDEDGTEEIIRKEVSEAPMDDPREEDGEDDYYSPSFSRAAEYNNNRLNSTAIQTPAKKLIIPTPSIPLENTISPHGPGILSASMASLDQNGTVPLSNIGARSRLFAQPQQPAPQGPGTSPLGNINLANLSPLKQAVVMSEILGPPKALQ